MKPWIRNNISLSLSLYSILYSNRWRTYIFLTEVEYIVSFGLALRATLRKAHQKLTVVYCHLDQTFVAWDVNSHRHQKWMDERGKLDININWWSQSNFDPPKKSQEGVTWNLQHIWWSQWNVTSMNFVSLFWGEEYKFLKCVFF